jgi:hypothetical protein
MKTGSRPLAENLFGFVMRANSDCGRHVLAREKSHLQFVLITRDISENSREDTADFRHYPVIQHYTTAELEAFFGIQGAKVVGFKKSGLAHSLYTSLKEHRINKPVGSAGAPDDAT